MTQTEAEVDDQVRRATTRFGPAIAQVFAATSDGQPDPVGSGVLLAVADRHFLLTAAHVLDHQEESALYLAVDGGKTVELLGTALTSGLPSSGDRREDEVDVAAVELAAETTSRLPSTAFLAPSDLDVNEVADQAALYVVMGYPHRKTQRRPGLMLRSVLYKYVARSGAESYSKVGRSEVDSLVLDFRRERVRFEGKQQTAPHPEGMSGGPVFRLTPRSSPLEREAPATLVGLLTDYPAQSHVLIAPRISLWVAHLQAAVPELSASLPSLSRFRPVFRSIDPEGQGSV